MCKFYFNNQWYEEAELEYLFNNMESKFDSGSVAASVQLSEPPDAVNKQLTFMALSPLRRDPREIFNQIDVRANTINATLKIIDALQRTPRSHYPSNSVQGFYNDLIKQGAPKNQIDLLKEHIAQNNITEINTNSLITSLLSEMSYTVEINTAKESMSDSKLQELNIKKEFQKDNFRYFSDNEGYWKFDNTIDAKDRKLEKIDLSDYVKAYRESIEKSPTQHYSNLTVPGGTNYTEQEISTPLITPSIKGHAAFSTDSGIGWFRTDDKQNYTEQDIDTLIDNMIKSGVLQKNCS